MRSGHSELPKLPKGVVYTLVWVCAIGGSMAAYATLNRPLAGWRKGLSQQAEDLQVKLSKGADLRREHAEGRRRLEALLAHVELVNSRVPEQPLEGEFLAEVTNIASENGVSIEDFHRGESVTLPTHSVVTVTLTARGSHRGICGLVDSVSNLPRVTELSQLDVRNAGESDGHLIRLTYALYYGMNASPDEGGAR